MSLESKDVVSLVLGGVGAILGVLNTANLLNQQRVRLRVVAKTAILTGGGTAFVTYTKDLSEANWGCIEVTNLSSFPVPISEIGFTLSASIKRGRMPIFNPATTDRQPFARTLQPHQAVSGYFPSDAFTSAIHSAYARTDSDEVAYGRNSAIIHLRRIARGRQ